MTMQIEIVSPITGAGLGRVCGANERMIDEFNGVFIGAIVTDIITEENGNQLKKNITDETVKVITSDPAQNTDIKGTGTFWGNPRSVGYDMEPCFYYGFQYHFKKVGIHRITFKVGEIEQSIEMEITLTDVRP